MNCILCKNIVEFLDNYKFTMKDDKNHFGNLEIYYCKSCDLGFVSPMPDIQNLNKYYKEVYRSGARPHLVDDNYNLEYLADRNLSYFSYLSSFINFEKINNIFDYGAGNGNLGYLIRKKFNHINLSSIELGEPSKKILRKRDYKLYENFNEITEKFDLIISTRAIQQLTNFEIFDQFRQISHENTYVFLDIPNNEFKNKFFKRPYDTPGLIFYSKKSFLKLKDKFNFEIINMSYSSYSIDQAYKYMEKSNRKLSFENKTNLWQLKKVIKKFIPNLLLKFKIFLKQNSEKEKLIEEYMLNKKDSWMIKIIFKWKNFNAK